MRLHYWYIHFVIPVFMYICFLLIHNNKTKRFEKYNEKSFKHKYFNGYRQIFRCLASNDFIRKTHTDNNSCPFTPSKIKVLRSPNWASDLEFDSSFNKILVSFFILSSPGNFDRRRSIRNELENFIAHDKRITSSTTFKLATQTFVIGNSDNVTINSRLKNEMDKLGDILLLSVQDSYRNLPVKSIGYFTWITNLMDNNKQSFVLPKKKEIQSTFKSNEYEKKTSDATETYVGHDIIRWIVKIDDDVNVNYNKLFEYLEKEDGNTVERNNFENLTILCSTVQNNNIAVQRNDCMTRKWKTEINEWPSEILYPSYCNGWLYVVTPKIVRLLLSSIPTSPYLFIDDVYITGILRSETRNVGIRQMDFSDQFKLFQCPFLSDARKYFFSSLVYPKDIDWKNFPALVVKCLFCYIIELIGLCDVCKPF